MRPGVDRARKGFHGIGKVAKYRPAYQPDPGKGEARPLDESVDNHLEDRVNRSHLAHGQRNRLQEFQIHGIRLLDSSRRNNDSSLRFVVACLRFVVVVVARLA